VILDVSKVKSPWLVLISQAGHGEVSLLSLYQRLHPAKLRNAHPTGKLLSLASWQATRKLGPHSRLMGVPWLVLPIVSSLYLDNAEQICLIRVGTPHWHRRGVLDVWLRKCPTPAILTFSLTKD
jgi:hypothetical protein